MAKNKIGKFERFMPKDRTGISIRENPKNGFVVVELDFIVQPHKRDPEWIKKTKNSMPKKRWEIEMMRSWHTFAGKPIYEDIFFKNLHVLKIPRSADPDYPIFRGWDFGGNQSCVITQIIGSQIIVLDELPNAGTNTRTFAPEVISHCNQAFGPEFVYFDIIDPSAMWEGKTAGGFSCSQVMKEFNLDPKPARTNDPELRIDAVTKFLMGSVKSERTLLINPHCNMLIKGFEGGYHYPEKPSQSRRMDRPVKNLYSHIHDGLQYVCLRALKLSKRNHDEEIEYERALTGYSFTGSER